MTTSLPYRPTSVVHLIKLGFTVICVTGMFAARTAAHAEPNCAVKSKLVDGESITATASSWANLRNNKGSLRFESARMLSAVGSKPPTAPADFSCGDGCTAADSPTVVFRSLPSKFLSDYSEKAHCEALLKSTTSKPFAYHGRKFADGDKLNTWFGDFSQGKGPDGTDLYTRCDGDCSPQYTCVVRKQPDGSLVVDADVVCGHARDKDDNNYDLNLSYRYQCK